MEENHPTSPQEERLVTVKASSLARLADALACLSRGQVVELSPSPGDPDELSELMSTLSTISGRLAKTLSAGQELNEGLAEYFDLLHRVGSGDFDARATYSGPSEILSYLRELTNSTLDRLSKEAVFRRAAKEESAMLVTAVEQTAEGVLITDSAGRCVYVNPAFVEMSGYTRSELMGMPMRAMDAVTEESVAAFREMTDTVSVGGVWRGILPSRKKGGQIYSSECTISPVRDESGYIRNYVVLRRDVTLEIQMKRRLEQSRKLESLGTLSGGIAHELNNILTPIIGYTELVLEDVGNSPQVKKNLQHILSASERAREILWKILTFSRSEEEEEEARGVRLGKVVRETLELFEATIPPTIKIEYDSLLVGEDIVAAGITQLQQVLLNLAMNSVAAMPDRKGTIRITLKEPGPESMAKFMKDRTSESYVELIVADSGEGMEPEKLDRIFEPFYTTKPVGEGTGLGLSVVHGIIRNYGGFISVESKPGLGTAFHIFLPRVDLGLLADEDQAQPLPVGGKERILLVDDEEAVVNVFRLQLEGLGYKVEAYQNPTAALAAFMRNPSGYDLLLTDNSMPVMSGVVLGAEVRLVRPKLPMIICTGFSNAINSDDLAQLGEVTILDKPVMVRELAASVRALLDK